MSRISLIQVDEVWDNKASVRLCPFEQNGQGFKLNRLDRVATECRSVGIPVGGSGLPVCQGLAPLSLILEVGNMGYGTLRREWPTDSATRSQLADDEDGATSNVHVLDEATTCTAGVVPYPRRGGRHHKEGSTL